MHSFYNIVSGPLAWIAFLLFFGGSIYRIVSMLRLVAEIACAPFSTGSSLLPQ